MEMSPDLLDKMISFIKLVFISPRTLHIPFSLEAFLSFVKENKTISTGKQVVHLLLFVLKTICAHTGLPNCFPPIILLILDLLLAVLTWNNLLNWLIRLQWRVLNQVKLQIQTNFILTKATNNRIRIRIRKVDT